MLSRRPHIAVIPSACLLLMTVLGCSVHPAELDRYILAVMRSYIEVKEARGRTKQEIGWKLEILEREASVTDLIRC